MASELILDRELHNPGTFIRLDFPERRTVEGRRWISQVHAVLNVEGFPSDFDDVPFTDCKFPRQALFPPSSF